MAMSAFRSTTKRGCQFGSSAEASVPSTPRSKREPSPGPRHRRSSSMSDFSAKYFSDCDRLSYNKDSRRRGGRSSVCPSDSESDIEIISFHKRHLRGGADFLVERQLNPIRSGNNASQQPNHLGKISSHEDSTKCESSVMLHDLIPSNDFAVDNGEDYAEEKTIRDVCGQMKSLRTNPPVGDTGTSDFLDAMRSEVRRAVAEIRMELEDSMQRNRKSSRTSHEGSSTEAQSTDVIQAVADIRKEYSKKLEQSEKRVRELWSQLAVEERRCLELAKIVQELLPSLPSPGPDSLTAHVSTNRRRSHRRKNSAEKQVVSVSLEDEALKYFEECVSISPLDGQGDSNDSCHGIDQHSKAIQEELFGKISSSAQIVAEASDEFAATGAINMLEGDRQLKNCLVGSDGVVLPWLQWEAEAGACDKNPKKVGKQHVSKRSSNGSSSRANGGSTSLFYRNSHTKQNTVKKMKSFGKESISTGLISQTSLLGAASDEESDVPICKISPDYLESVEAFTSATSSLFTFEDKMADKDGTSLDIDIQMFERLRFGGRVESRELLLCQGLFL